MIAFRVEFEDGAVVTEEEGTWDDVPRDRPVVSVALYDTETGAELLKADGGRAYFFANEAIAAWGQKQGRLSGKILGVVSGDEVLEARLDLLHSPMRASERRYALVDCPFTPAAFRLGLHQQ